MIRTKKDALIIKQGHFTLFVLDGLYITSRGSGLARNKRVDRVDAYGVRDRQPVASTIEPGQVLSKEYGANPDHRRPPLRHFRCAE
jgi:hypothetical protein